MASGRTELSATSSIVRHMHIICGHSIRAPRRPRLKATARKDLSVICTECGLICQRWDWCQKDLDAGYFGTFTPVVSAGAGARRGRWRSCRACAASHGAEETAIKDVSGAYNGEQFGWQRAATELETSDAVCVEAEMGRTVVRIGKRDVLQSGKCSCEWWRGQK